MSTLVMCQVALWPHRDTPVLLRACVTLVQLRRLGWSCDAALRCALPHQLNHIVFNDPLNPKVHRVCTSGATECMRWPRINCVQLELRPNIGLPRPQSSHPRHISLCPLPFLHSSASNPTRHAAGQGRPFACDPHISLQYRVARAHD